jgi:hypothetical protein
MERSQRRNERSIAVEMSQENNGVTKFRSTSPAWPVAF